MVPLVARLFGYCSGGGHCCLIWTGVKFFSLVIPPSRNQVSHAVPRRRVHCHGPQPQPAARNVQEEGEAVHCQEAPKNQGAEAAIEAQDVLGFVSEGLPESTLSKTVRQGTNFLNCQTEECFFFSLIFMTIGSSKIKRRT